MPQRGRPFIDREVFYRLIQETPRHDGDPYEDLTTIYGDLSRLVVAWIDGTDAATLAKLYNDLGWRGSANVRAIKAAARTWMATHRTGDENTTENRRLN